ncbi:type VI secretion system Vgr family protein [Pseudomonas sp. SCB32]|uniref:type VI secretion system Vgr family protein n=1 Tax=Pseudomonas sp. SCB32 TaxID=2653853 RepID=UPI0012646C79|nr:type VI secretion system tip protein TssI/VgrG [Pseudomonas sp. SCB32]
MNRIVTLQGTFSDSDVRFLSLRGRESLSSLYEFEVQVLSTNYSLESKQTLGTQLSLNILLAKGGSRQLGGQVTRMEMLGRQSNTSRDYVYRLTVRPWLWFLTCTSDCKIFQKKNVVEILDEVLGDYDYPVEKRLKSSYRQWEYCVQYQETDFNFVSRLMEQEGIYFYFEHGEAGETLVLADDISAHANLPDHDVLAYLPPDRLVNGGEVGVSNWQSGEEVRPGSYMVGDYDFAKPKADMRQLRATLQRHANDQFEMYDWMGGFVDQVHAENYSRIRLEEAQALRERTQAQSQLPGIRPGYSFSLSGHPRSAENRAYLVVSATYDFLEGGYATGSDSARYDTHLTVQPVALPYRAPRVTPFPFTHGPQTAVVVGPQGEEIWTDQYGRVKVQFHWDRYGQNNENSSCWVRVSSNWAGSNFGGLQIPRIGQEVVVDFINGMPDRPLIIGRVYNADQMPPFSLPASRTQSGIVTRSFEHGSVENANMLRFDDKRGAEQIKLHAERNFDVSVENDENHHIQGNLNTRALQSINKQTPTYTEAIKDSTSTVHSSTSVVGSSVSATGSAVSATLSVVQKIVSLVQFVDSAVSNTGNAVGTTGSAINTTGSAISTTGSSISNTGISIAHVGYSVTS